MKDILPEKSNSIAAKLDPWVRWLLPAKDENAGSVDASSQTKTQEPQQESTK